MTNGFFSKKHTNVKLVDLNIKIARFKFKKLGEIIMFVGYVG